MRFPTNYISITQGFKDSGINKHYAIDLGWYGKECGYNQPIYACEDGKVIKIEYQVTGGYVIQIRHDFGNDGYYVSSYGHLQKGSIKVKLNQNVKKGQQIANMGKTGICTGYHLDFAIYRGYNINYKTKQYFVNPLRFLNMYDGQVALKKTLDNYKLYHTKVVKGVKDEPLLVHNQPNYNKSSVCGGLYNGDVVEYYGTYNGMAVINTIGGRWCSNKYIK